MNFGKKILETRRVHYRHLKNLLVGPLYIRSVFRMKELMLAETYPVKCAHRDRAQPWASYQGDSA